jgi:uncharacterized protein YxjI
VLRSVAEVQELRPFPNFLPSQRGAGENPTENLQPGFDTADNQVAEVKGDWKGWNFRFLNKGGREIGSVTKKWAGLGKELFTSADNYIIALTDAEANRDTRSLLLAAGICIDVVFKESE